jgi:LacI family transcriptional regulator
LICFNDRLAIGAYNALADAGLVIPTDVAVLSFDDDPIASWVQPQLTTIAIPHYELGRKSIEILLDGPAEHLSDDNRVHRVRMPLRKRQSM